MFLHSNWKNDSGPKSGKHSLELICFGFLRACNFY